MTRPWLGPWWAVLLSVAGIGIGVAAGTWQLDRADQKRELEARFAAGGTGDALRRLVPVTPELRYRAVQLTGRYDPGHQVLLDNISAGRQPGYLVLTPFATDSGTVLVNRGWVPASGDRRELPDIRVDDGPREIRGRVDWLPRPGLELPAPAVPATAPWPRRLLFPTAAALSAQLKVALPDYQVLLDPAAPDGYRREWQAGGMPPARHVAYAVQWFGLALTVAVIHIVLVQRFRKTTP